PHDTTARKHLAGGAPANREVGKSWCFVRDKWEKGLPYLAKGNDPVLKQIAVGELAAPTKAKDQLALAQAWWNVAQKHKGQTKLLMLRRSFQWHVRVVNQLDGNPKVQAQAKLNELTKLLPSKLRVTEIDTELWKLTGHTGDVLTVAFALDGVRAASGGADKSIRVWDLVTGKTIQTCAGHTASVVGVAFTPDGKQVVSCAEDKTVRVWDTGTGKELRQ